MLKYLAHLFVCISQIVFAQKIFTQIPLNVKPASFSLLPSSERLFISYKYFDAIGKQRTSMIWVDSVGSSHKIPDNDFLSKNFFKIIKNDECDYFYFLQREDNFYFINALIINRETRAYHIPKEKILIDGYPLGCYEKNGDLKFLSFHEATKEFVETNIKKLVVSDTKKFLLPVNRLDDFIVITPEMSLIDNMGKYTTKIFPQSSKTIITIDSESPSKASDTLFTTVFSLDNNTENVSQLNIDEQSDGHSRSFVHENTLFRIINSKSKCIIRSYNIDKKVELSNLSIFPDSAQNKRTIWKRNIGGGLTDQYPLNSFFKTIPRCEPTVFVVPVDSSNLSVYWGASYTAPDQEYMHVNPNSGNIWFDLIYVVVIEPAINVAAQEISEAIDKGQSEKPLSTSRIRSESDFRYFYANYDTKVDRFSDMVTTKTTSQLIDEFDDDKANSNLTKLGRAIYNNHECGVYYKRKKIVLVTFK